MRLPSTNNVQASAQEIADLIKRSGLITIVVEGKDDLFVYRILEHIYEDNLTQVDVLSAGGRGAVLEVFDKLKNTSHLHKTIFIVDQDLWIFTGIPSEYNNERIITTSGYSIENDIFIDRQLEALMGGCGILTSFRVDLQIFLRWYSLAINRITSQTELDGETLKLHPDTFFKTHETINTYCSLKQGEVFPQSIYDDLSTEYHLKFRGKSLLPLALKALNSRPSHPKYNSKSIMEETAISQRGIHLNRIFSKVGALI